MGFALVEDVGTLAYQAPEMLDGSQHDSRADIWSLGCVIFSICNFDFPFNAQSEKRLTEKIRTVAHKPIDGNISQEIRDLYDICMNKNYQTRPFTSDLLGLEMIQNWAKDLGIMNQQLVFAQRNREYDAAHFLQMTRDSLKIAKEPRTTKNVNDS